MVIVTDGEWGDEVAHLTGSLIERLKASGVYLTIARYTNRRERNLDLEVNLNSYQGRCVESHVNPSWRPLKLNSSHGLRWE